MPCKLTCAFNVFRREGHTGFGLVVWKNSGIHLDRGRGLSGGDAYQKGKWCFIFATCFTFASKDYAHLFLIKIKKQRNIKENSYREKQTKMVCCNYASNYAAVFCFYPGKASAVHRKAICTPQKIDKNIRLNHTHLTNFVYPYLQTVFLPL